MLAFEACLVARDAGTAERPALIAIGLAAVERPRSVLRVRRLVAARAQIRQANQRALQLQEQRSVQTGNNK